MGKRGPQRTPLAVLSARGSWRAKTRSEAPFEAGVPVMPDGLTEAEQGYWRDLCETLSESGVLSEADGMMLFALVDAISAFQAAREKSFPGPRSRARADLMRCLAKFGLTPADRTNVSPAPLPREDPLAAKFFKTGSIPTRKRQ